MSRPMAHDNSKADPQQTANAKAMWDGFTSLMKWSIVSIAILLILMAVFLV